MAVTGGHAADGWHGSHEGFRSDADLTPRDTLMVQGDFLQTEEGQTQLNVPTLNVAPPLRTFNDRVDYRGGDVLGRWGHILSNGSVMELAVYDDFYSRRTFGALDNSNTVDLDFQYHLAIGLRNDLVWGVCYRLTTDTVLPGYTISFASPQHTDNLISTFVQDEIRITRALSLTLGSKFEHNAYTGFEVEPSAQLVWEFGKQTLWASAARAIRQPAREDSGMTVYPSVVPLGNGAYGVVRLQGSPNPKAEQLRDFEIGHRAQIGKRLSIDSVAFFSLFPCSRRWSPKRRSSLSARGLRW